MQNNSFNLNHSGDDRSRQDYLYGDRNRQDDPSGSRYQQENDLSGSRSRQDAPSGSRSRQNGSFGSRNLENDPRGNENRYEHEWVPYESISGTAPRGLKKPRTKRELKFWQCLVFFICMMAVWIFTNGWVYLLTGNMDLDSFAMELEFVVASVLFVFFMRADPKEVFPLHKPRMSAVFGVLILVVVGYLAADVVTILEMFFVPHALQSIDEGLAGTYSSSLPVELFLTAFMPAVCEEALHRGVLVSGLRTSFRKRWQIILVGGVLFGVFHIYPVRWWIPGILGALMTWVILETDNIFYTSLLHFCYNGLLVVVSFLASDTTSPASYTASPQMVGVSLLFYGIPLPILIYTGCWLIRRSVTWKKPAFIEPGLEEKRLAQILVPTGGILLTGILFLLIPG